MSSTTLRFLSEPSSSHGGKVDGGTVMKWIHDAGYACATAWSKRHCTNVAVGNMHFQRTIETGWLVEVQARLAYTGTTSMNLSVEVRASDMKTGPMEKITECILVFVALQADGNPVPVRAWHPETPGDMALAQHVKAYLDVTRAMQVTI